MLQSQVIQYVAPVPDEYVDVALVALAARAPTLLLYK
jgi:hypothetical protein